MNKWEHKFLVFDAENGPKNVIDNLNTYYDIELKLDRLKILKKKSKKFSFKKIDIVLIFIEIKSIYCFNWPKIHLNL